MDIDHRIMKQQYNTLFPLNGIWVVERPVLWHANKKTLVIFGVVNVLFYKSVELYFGGQMSNDWRNGQTVQATALKALTMSAVRMSDLVGNVQ